LQRGLRGRWPDLAGPQRLRWDKIAQQWLAARGEARCIVHLPLPGKSAAALRAGYNTVPERLSGTVTWEAWLTGQRHGKHGGGPIR